ncbi:MAG: porin [Alphaproteobacteria bacterium]|jgi:Gram-negative porin|nr:porin [Alphaproteobacteria bacterium]
MKHGPHPLKLLSLLTACALVYSGNAEAEGQSQAQAPTLKINGFTSFAGYGASQQRKDNGKGGTDPQVNIGASDLYFTVTGKASNGMEYKYRINFETIPGSDAYVNKNYVELNGDFGTTQLGQVSGPEDAMPESGANLIGGANGIDGTLNSAYNYSAGVIKGVNFVGETKKAAKVVFYSPEVLGFQLGAAYTPNTSHMGESSKNNATVGANPGVGNSSALYPNSKNTGPYGIRNVTVGLTHKGSNGKWSHAFAVVGVVEKSVYTDYSNFGDQRRVPLRNAKSYQLSASVGYDQWKVAAGWIDNGKSRLPRDGSLSNYSSAAGSNAGKLYLGNSYLGNSGKAWNVGTSYTVGAYQFAAAFHRTDRMSDATSGTSSDIIATSVDLSALQGLKVYGEVDFIKTRTNLGAKNVQQSYMTNVEGKGNTAIGDNSGAVFVLGTKVSF